MSGRRIEMNQVDFSYQPGLPVLWRASLTVEPGLTLVLGPNGSGKSTLLRLVAGVEKPERGSIRINGHDLWEREADARRDLAYVPEEPDLTPYATVLEILVLVCRLRGEPVARAGEALAEAGLGGLSGRSVRQLSKGQRRRALIAAAWIGTPRTVLLDEPLDAVDELMRERLLAWLRGVRAEGGLAIVVSHDIEPFVEMVDHCVGVTGGQLRRIERLPRDRGDRARLLHRLARGESGDGGS